MPLVGKPLNHIAILFSVHGHNILKTDPWVNILELKLRVQSNLPFASSQETDKAGV